MGDVGDPLLPHSVRIPSQLIPFPEFSVQPVQAFAQVAESPGAQIAAPGDFINGNNQLLYCAGKPEAIQDSKKGDENKQDGSNGQKDIFSAGETFAVKIHGIFRDFYRKMKQVGVLLPILCENCGKGGFLPAFQMSAAYDAQELCSRVVRLGFFRLLPG